MAWYRIGGGGDGNKSIVLPTNPTITISPNNQTLTITWTSPTTEVAIDHWNVYYSLTTPTSLSDMTKQGSTTSTTYTLTGLTNDQTYYIAVESVDANGYENASIWEVKSGVPIDLIFVCGSTNGATYYSTDGETWLTGGTTCTTTPSYNEKIAHGNGRFLCCGYSGATSTLVNYAYYSTDGINWTKIDNYPTTMYCYGITYGDDRFVLISTSGASYYSTDNGETWTAMSGLSSSFTPSSSGNCVTYGNDRFVCVGASGLSYYSTDGETWTAMSGLSSYTYIGVTYGNDRFVCVGQSGKSYRSTDGETWTAMSGLSSYTYIGVTYGNGRFVCVGYNGKSYYSTDGVNWTTMTGLPSQAFGSVTYGNGRFVCGGNCNSYSYYSTNGTSWTAMSGAANVRFVACNAH